MISASIFEEFGWRGYLEPKLREVNRSTIMNHVIVGSVWGIWHFPILIFNKPDTDIFDLLIVLIGCIALGVIYGQIRLKSDSVWPCVFLHGFSNTFTIAFATSDLLQIGDSYKEIISFNTTSFAVTGLWILTSLVFLLVYLKKRKETASRPSR
jgi:membrane protease YdiL (CAAX protease family)